ncbi:conserved hypothetical protein [Methylobacterium sp. 4-46]|uniref:SHOCT domain-containing protein n=1 Tax=unclassified Methylobacterium TaxID=2615210 RepID=UPI000152BFC0|nr:MULTISPECIES: SHOCT domain-containing protein [Methylobacterium]ACA15003.1 conserved hypothetical protein [Methylobacterium sp. 4-46]WFT80741.1 SHOCT domain-containing protein [Methylobacterium nodulans]
MLDLSAIAARHGVSVDAARHLAEALAQGGGTAAQFNHPDLGGMGQWSSGGMIMIGDMFNAGLKARVAALCADLAPIAGRLAAPAGWWPAELGHPASAGSQNGLRYAYFPDTRRLAVEAGGQLAVYDTGEHRIGGVSQQQGGASSLLFTSQFGPVRPEDLPLVSGGAAQAPAPPVPAPPQLQVQGWAQPAPPPAAPQAPPAAPQAEPPIPAPAPAAAAVPAAAGDPLALIERLAELHRKGVLTEAEFTTKKSELLGRL